MLDRAFRLTFAEFSTFFLVVLIAVAPLQIAHSYWFREVIEVADLHDEIESFPADRTVRDVGAEELRDYRASLALLTIIELGLALLGVRAVRVAAQDSLGGKVPTAVSAWRRGFSRKGSYLRAAARKPGPLVAAAAIALVVGILSEGFGLLVIQPLGDANAWTGIAAVRSVSRALAAPFLLVTWACLAIESGRNAKEKTGDVPKLY